jgi:cytochrome c553
MKKIITTIMLCGLLIGSTHAEDAPTTVEKAPAKSPAQELDRDSVCTRCHDENESKPILAIYQTAHGNKADSRTPSC